MGLGYNKKYHSIYDKIHYFTSLYNTLNYVIHILFNLASSVRLLLRMTADGTSKWRHQRQVFSCWHRSLQWFSIIFLFMCFFFFIVLQPMVHNGRMLHRLSEYM